MGVSISTMDISSAAASGCGGWQDQSMLSAAMIGKGRVKQESHIHVAQGQEAC